MLLKISQVAEQMGASIGNVYGLIEAGKLPYVPLGAGGKGYRVLQSDLDEFIQSRRTFTPIGEEENMLRRAKPRHLRV